MPSDSLVSLALQQGSWIALLAIFALHNFEEWRWIARHPLKRLPARLPANLYAQEPLGYAMVFLTLMAALPCVALVGGASGMWLQLGFILAGGLGFNALSHLGQTIVRRHYNPGAYTAGPMLCSVFIALSSNWHTLPGTAGYPSALLFAGILLTLPVIALALLAGHTVCRTRSWYCSLRRAR